MSQWLVDIGNSRCKLAPLRSGRAGPIQIWEHTHHQAIATAAIAAIPVGKTAYVASVASSHLTQQVLAQLQRRFTHVHQVRPSAQFQTLRLAYDQPTTFGVDRFLSLIAAQGPGAVLIVGVGTALTLDVLAANGEHLGGRISASPTMMRATLHQQIPHLPANGGRYTELANNTCDALASGCDGAAIALIDRCWRLAQVQLQSSVRLILHGGGAPALLHSFPDAEHCPSLVLDGLAIWAATHCHSQPD